MDSSNAEKAWTTGQVRETFVRGREQHADFPGINNARAEFESWLAAHDREVAARTLEDMADEGERFMFGATGERMPADDEIYTAPRWHEIRRLRERAAALRPGTEGGTD